MKFYNDPKKKEAGGALVETALLMIFFVPLIMYIFFMGESMIHLLDVQEAPIAAVWDFSMMPYANDRAMARNVKFEKIVEKYNRYQFADHDSSYIYTGELSRNTSDQRHYDMAFVQASWLSRTGGTNPVSTYSEYNNNSRPTEISCERSSRQVKFNDSFIGDAIEIFGAKDFREKFDNQGGMFTCWAKARLMNYILPSGFLQNFGSPTSVYSGTKYKTGTNVDGNVVAAAGDGTDIIVKSRAAIFADSWADLSSDHLPANGGGHKDYSVQDTDIFDSKQREGNFHERVNMFFQPKWSVLGVLNTLRTASIHLYGVSLLGWGLAEPYYMGGAVTIDTETPLWIAAKYPHSHNGNVSNYYERVGVHVTGHSTTGTVVSMGLGRMARKPY